LSKFLFYVDQFKISCLILHFSWFFHLQQYNHFHCSPMFFHPSVNWNHQKWKKSAFKSYSLHDALKHFEFVQTLFSLWVLVQIDRNLIFRVQEITLLYIAPTLAGGWNRSGGASNSSVYIGMGFRMFVLESEWIA